MTKGYILGESLGQISLYLWFTKIAQHVARTKALE